MKKFILILLVIGLFSCQKEDNLKPTVNEFPYDVKYTIEVEQYHNETVSLFYRKHQVLYEIEYIESGVYEIETTAKKTELLELGVFGRATHIQFLIYVNGKEKVNHGFQSFGEEYENVIYEL